MSCKWRLVEFINDDGALQMALDEAIMIAREEGRVPNTLRFYTFQNPLITIGRNQSACEVRSAFVRRITGGSAVQHDPNDLTYAVIMKKPNHFKDVASGYYYISDMLIRGLNELGAPAIYSAKNYRKNNENCYLNENPYDIEVAGRKISGNAQTSIRGIILQHGTVILARKAKKISSLGDVLSQNLSFDLVMEKLKFGFATELKKQGIQLVEESITDYEWWLAKELYEKKYGQQDWNDFGTLP